MTLGSLALHRVSILEASKLIKTKGRFVGCLGEAADLVGGKEKHLLICEPKLFDLKINRSKLVRLRETFSRHTLLQ